MKKLSRDFYLHKDVLKISRGLIGKFLVTRIGNKVTSGMIIETEAYKGAVDKASHAYNNRRTTRNEVMYAQGGISYVYLCYGIHHLFNIVTNAAEIPHAVLIRAILPKDGLALMMKRRSLKSITKKFSDGPGTMSQALGIKTMHSGISLNGDTIFLEDRNINFANSQIETGPRIGIDYAGEDALLPYRFRLKENVINKFRNEWYS